MFEPTKSQAMTATLRRTGLDLPPLLFGGTLVPETTTITLLGVKVDAKLTFSDHLRSAGASPVMGTGGGGGGARAPPKKIRPFCELLVMKSVVLVESTNKLHALKLVVLCCRDRVSACSECM